jgi:hypothetical protein
MNIKVKASVSLMILTATISTSSLFQLAQAEDSWLSLLNPFLNSVIVPAMNTGITKLEAKVSQKHTNTATTTSVSSISTPVTTPISSISAPATPSVSATISVPSASTTDTSADNWKLPEEPQH